MIREMSEDESDVSSSVASLNEDEVEETLTVTKSTGESHYYTPTGPQYAILQSRENLKRGHCNGAVAGYL